MNPRKSQGFSLIELMIVVAILGVLASISYPSYNEHVKKTRRADARGAMMGLANALERYRINNLAGGYSGAKIGSEDGSIFPNKAPIDGSDKYYDLVLTNLTGTTYTITAKPYGIQANDECGSLVLNQGGTRSVTGGSKSVSECW